MIRQLAIALCAAGALGCAAAPPKDYEERPVDYAKPDSYRLRVSSSFKEWSGPQRLHHEGLHHFGLVAPDGRVIVPLEMGWVDLLFVNERWAIGKAFKDPAYKIVRLPEGTIEDTPYVSYHWWTLWGSSVKHLNMHSRPRWEENRFDVTFMDASGRPAREYKDLGGASVPKEGYIGARLFRGFGSSYLCLDTTMPDGSAVSRLMTLDGLPVGPIVPRIIAYEYIPAFREPPPSVYRYEMSSQYGEWGWIVGTLNVAGLPDPRYVQPMSRDGLPLPLPAGAVGLIPLSWGNSTTFVSPQYLPFHSGWAIVFPTEKGVEYAIGLGTAEEVLAKASSLPRYDGLREVKRYDKHAKPPRGPFLAAKKVGQPSWELLITDTLLSAMPLPATEILPTYEALIARWERHRADIAAKEADERRRQEAAEAEKRRSEREAYLSWARPHFEAVLAGREQPGRVWTLKYAAEYLNRTEEYKAFVARKLREEAVNPTPQAKYWISESRELGTEAHRAVVDRLEADAAEARLKEHERQRIEYDKVAAFQRAVEEARINANASSPNPATAGYTDTYKRNMEAWNKGQLNWFTPEHLKK